jgi:hypothetical protein
MTDQPAGDDPPDPGEPPAFSTPDRVLAGLILVGVVVLAYICLDVLADGAVTRALTGRRQTDDG